MPQDVKQKNNLSISNQSSQLPDYATPVENSLPDYAEPVKSEVVTPNEQPNLASRAWATANKPIVDIMSPFTREATEQLGHPGLDDSVNSARLKGFVTGGMQGLSDLISSESSPLSLGLGAMGASAVGARNAGLESLAKSLEMPGKAATAGMIGHGGYNMINAPDLAGKLGGFTEAAMGGAGLAHLNSPKIKPKIPLGWDLKDMRSASLSGENLGEPNLADVPREHQPVGGEDLAPRIRLKDTDQFAYDLARNKLQMGLDIPSDGPKPLIKDYWITGKDGKKILNPKYQNLGKKKVDITEGFGGNGHPESPDYVDKVLKSVDRGVPGLSIEKARDLPGGVPLNGTNIVYRDSQGHPIVVAKVVQDTKGKNMVMDLAADKSRGLLIGRAVKAVGEKLKEMGATEAAGTTSPDAQNLINKGLKSDKPSNEKLTAVFKGYQERMEGDPVALYNVKGGEFNNSTVAAAKLKELGIEVPKTPTMDEAGFTGRRATQIEKPTLANLLKGETGAIRFGPNKEKPIRSKNTRTAQSETIDKLVAALKEAAPKREEQEELYSAERAKRIQSAERVKETGLPGFYKQLHELKGELPKVDFERTKLSASEVNDLINTVTNSQRLLPYEKIRAKMALLKILSAKREELPQRNELALLGQVFGESFDPIIEMHGGLGGPIAKKVLLDVANMPKAIMASIDLSAPMRQGLPLIHKKEWWSSIGPMLKAFGSQDYFDALQTSLKDRPGYLLGKEAGLKLTEMGDDPAIREEAYGSKLANLIPGVKPSERAYVGFLNKLRADTFDSLILAGQDQGLHPKDIMHEVANFVNVATGRGSLGRLDKVAHELNTVFFSPRLIASRLTILNPNYYVSATPFVRQEAIKSLLAIAGTGVTINALMAAMGAKTNFDPRNADFMKSKFGNTRVDPYGGFQQYVVAASRLITGDTVSSNTNKITHLGKGFNTQTKKDVIENFFANKLSPAASLAWTIAKQKDFAGKPVNIPKEIEQRFIPMFLNDLYEIYKDDPNHLPLGAASMIGMGIQTYKPLPRKSQQLRIH